MQTTVLSSRGWKQALSAALAFGVSALVLAGTTATANAQAWVGEQGSLTGSIGYQFDTSSVIVESGEGMAGPVDLKFRDNNIQIQNLIFGVEYVPWKKLAVSATLPLTLARYTGESEFFDPHGEWDDGNLHAGLTDLHLTVRYPVIEWPLTITPIVGVSVPVMDYPVIGFTAPGRGLKRLHLGVAMARTLDPFLPRMYITGSYEWQYVERADYDEDLKRFGQNMSRFGMQIGYSVLDRLDVNIAFDAVEHHGGIDFVDFGMFPEAVKNYHDVVLNESAYLVGAGVGYQISDNLGAGLAFRTFVRGNNTRKARLVALSLSWTASVGPTEDYEDEDEDLGDEDASVEAETASNE